MIKANARAAPNATESKLQNVAANDRRGPSRSPQRGANAAIQHGRQKRFWMAVSDQILGPSPAELNMENGLPPH